MTEEKFSLKTEYKKDLINRKIENPNYHDARFKEVGVATRWVKGQKGNPAGKPKLRADLEGIVPMTPYEVSQRISRYLRMSMSALEAKMDPKAVKNMPTFDAVICSILAGCYKRGDPQRLDFLLNRCGLKVNPNLTITHKTEKDSELKDAVVKTLTEKEIENILITTSSALSDDSAPSNEADLKYKKDFADSMDPTIVHIN
jgi:hypothetical protein